MLALVLIPLSIVVGNGLLEILFLLSGVFLVLIVEILNSAIESAIDRFGQEENELSKKSKGPWKRCSICGYNFLHYYLVHINF